jgi:hypothetical protein
MRQQQQQRSRNRNRGRKSSNPLSRNFESNGPDVKIRGNASHIAEKYSVLARDAQTSGDTVMAENYFQHAEHYFRIIAANQQSNPQAENGRVQNNSQRDDSSNSDVNDTTESSRGENNRVETSRGDNNRNENIQGEGPQPDLGDVPAEVVLKEERSTAREVKKDNGRNEVEGEDPETVEPPKARRNSRKPATSRRTTRTTAKEKVVSATSKDAQVDGLSEDAALLPNSLIGSPSDTENDGTSRSSKD